MKLSEALDKIVEEANSLSDEELRRLDKSGYFYDYLNR